MRVRVMSLNDVLEHVPSARTSVISIASSHLDLNEYLQPVQQNPLYVVRSYLFDDCQPQVGNGVLFTKEHAQHIIAGFEEDRKSCRELIVHCLRGRNRSPAVAIALSELFRLEPGAAALKKQYPDYNQWVYQVMKEAGQESTHR